MLDVELLGHLRLSDDGRVLEGVRSARLLVYLLLHRDRARTRDDIAFALWPDSGDAQALTNLRRELHALRHALPESAQFLDLEHHALRWRPDAPCRLDVARFEAAVERGRRGEPGALREAVALYTGDLVPGIYDDWITPQRNRLRALYVEAVGALAGRLEDRREYRDAMDLLRRLIELDPLDETAYQALMRVAALAGDRSAGVQAYHACATTLQEELGIAPSVETQATYERLLAVGAGGSARSRASHGGATHRLIGRDVEWRSLTEAWRDVLAGRPTFTFVEGEAGIGKSRLLEELVRWTRAQGYAALYARSYAAEGALAYAPVAAWLRGEPFRGAFTRLEVSWLSEITRVLPELVDGRVDLRMPEPMTESWQRQRLFEALARAVRAAGAPLAITLDDAHWADHDTLEWLHYVFRAEPGMPLLICVAARSEEVSRNPALSAILVDLRERGALTQIDLHPLSEEETAALATEVADRALDPRERGAMYRESEGHPLMVVELARGGLTTLALDPEAARSNPDSDGPTIERRVPPRVRAVISARLDQLSPDVRDLLELAATFGRDFSFEGLAIASDLEDTAVVRALDDLWQRRIIRDLGLNTYDFSHDRIRDVAYAEILPARRRLLHRRIAQALESIHSDDLDRVAAQLAAHLEAAGQTTRAIDAYDRAATVAAAVSASTQAARHLTRAISLLGRTPASRARDIRELGLLLRLTRALLPSDGYASARQEETMERALLLAESVGQRADVLYALNGVWSVRLVGGEIQRSVELADALAEHGGNDAAMASVIHFCQAFSALFSGRIARSVEAFSSARTTFERGRSLPLTLGTDVDSFSAAAGSHALWLHGETGRAGQWSAEAIEAAEGLETPFGRVVAHSYAALLGQLRADPEAILSRVDVVANLCQRYRFAYYDQWVVILEAWATRSERRDGPERIERALERLASIRGVARRSYYLTLLADAHLAVGDTRAARRVLEAALADATDRGETWWIPDIHRRLGRLETGSAAVGHLHEAIALAGQQGSSALALRAALDLARRVGDSGDVLARTLAAVADPEPDDRVAAMALIGAAATPSRRGERLANVLRTPDP